MENSTAQTGGHVCVLIRLCITVSVLLHLSGRSTYFNEPLKHVSQRQEGDEAIILVGENDFLQEINNQTGLNNPMDAAADQQSHVIICFTPEFEGYFTSHLLNLI